MANPSTDFTRIKDVSGEDGDDAGVTSSSGPTSRWSSDSVALGCLVAIVTVCFLLVWSGLAVVSWQMINSRMRAENKTMVLSEDRNRMSDFPDYALDDSDIWWMFTGNLLFNVSIGLTFFRNCFLVVPMTILKAILPIISRNCDFFVQSFISFVLCQIMEARIFTTSC